MDDLLVPEDSENRKNVIDIYTSHLELEFLPAGIINKSETGVGGTTVELKANRNSIIVEPLKAIASSKAATNREYLYVGSPTKLFPKKISEDDIKNYHESSLKYKKIIVVADSLPKVIRAIGNDVYKHYFLLIDEIDSIQEGSTFRANIECTIDHYNFFPKDKRAVISATINDFCNPILQQEKVTIYNFPKKNIKRKICLVKTNDVDQAAVEAIVNLKHAKEKVLVAYNSIKQGLSVIDTLIAKHGFSKHDFGILCGEGSSEIVGEYFREYEGNVLPSKITFMTAAYFSGIDINESVHLITIINTRLPHTILSLNTLKQIAGRARKGLLEDLIIFNDSRGEIELATYPASYFIGRAKADLRVFDCIKLLKDEKEMQKYIDVQKKVLAVLSSNEPYSLLRENYLGLPDISYFKIDSIINEHTTLYMYSIEYLREYLEMLGHKVDKREQHYAPDDRLGKSANFEEARSLQLKKAIDNLENLSSPTTRDLKNIIMDNTHARYQGEIYRKYSEIVGYVNHKDFVSLIKDLNIDQSKDLRVFNNLILRLSFDILSAESDLKRELYNRFKVGSRHSPTAIADHLRQSLKNFLTDRNVRGKDLISFFRMIFKTRRQKVSNENVYEITGYSEPTLEIIRYIDKPELALPERML